MPTTIALIQTAFLGDAALSMILADQVHRAFPQSEIVFVCRPDSERLARANSAISRTIVFDKRGRDRGIGGIRRIAQQLKQQHVTITLCLQRSIRTAFVARACGAPIRIGFETAQGRWLLTHCVPYRTKWHEIERNASLLSALGIEPPPPSLPLRLQLDNQQQQRCDEAVAQCGNRPIAAIAPGAVWETKRWLPQRFADVALRLRSEGLSVAFIGGSADIALCKQLAARSGGVSFAGTLDPAETVTFLRYCSVLVANDSAPTHLATLAACPTVTIFGSTIPEFGFAPRAPASVVVEPPPLPCRPCTDHGRRQCPRGTLDCMHSIVVEDVFERVRTIVQSSLA